MEGLSRNNSFMDDAEGLNLGDDFFDDSGDLGRIFDDEDDDSHPLSVDKDLSKEAKGGSGHDFQRNHSDDDGDDDDHGDDDHDDDDKHDENSDHNNDEDKDGDGKSKKMKRRRSTGTGGASVEVDGAGAATPAWHSDAADKPHRETMIREIAQLLKARKKTAPTQEWMQQLPHKARVLEDKLYRKAPCLEAYLNRATLKNRLRKLAVTITAHYKKAVQVRKQSKRASTGSVSTLTTDVTRDPISSHKGPPPVNGNSAETALVFSRLRSQHPGSLGPPLHISSAQKVVPPEVAMSDLARQKAVNEELQKQIFENMRQQQQLVQSIRRESNSSHGGSTRNKNNNNSNSNMSSGNAEGNPMAAAAAPTSFPSMPGNFNNARNGSQIPTMSGNQFNNMQGQGAQFSNAQGNMMSHRASDSSGTASSSSSFEPQTALLRLASAPLDSKFNASQTSLMRQESNSPTGEMNNAAMQTAMLSRSSSSAAPSQAQFQAPQAALMRRSSSSQVPNQAAQAQMHAAWMRQASASSNHFNMAQAQAAFMRQASAGSNQMNTQVAQAALMRHASSGTNPTNELAANAGLVHQASLGNAPGPGTMFGNPGMMNQQMGPNGQAMQVASVFPNNQQMFQPNAAMMQSMNVAGMHPNMAQLSNLQQRMSMAAQGRNSMTMKGNDANEDAGASQNSFSW